MMNEESQIGEILCQGIRDEMQSVELTLAMADIIEPMVYE